MYRGPVVITELNSGVVDPISTLRYRIFGINQVASHELGLVAIGFQGSGAIGDSFVSNLDTLRSIVQKFSNINDMISLIKDAAGSFTLQILDENTGSIYFLNDPLGGGLIIKYLDDSLEAYAVDVVSIKMALTLYGVSLTRSLEYQIASFGTGTASLACDLPYDELTVMPAGVGIKLAATGSSTIIDYGVNSYIYEGNNNSYQDLIELGIDSMKRNICAVSTVPSKMHLADITGGFDSRLVLSGILSSGLQDLFTLSSIYENKEWEFAEGLSRVSGIPLTSERGWVRGVHRNDNFYEDCFASSRPSGGVIPNDLNPLAGPGATVSLQGGYGETFRTFSNYYVDPNKNISFEEMCHELWKWTKMSRLQFEGHKLFVDEAIPRLSNLVHRIFDRGINFELGPDLYPNILYMQLRNRYWIGQQSYWSSRIQVRFDPLYNRHLIAAAHKIDFWRRKSNFVGLDAMNLMTPQLLEFPWFQGDRVSARYRKEKYDPTTSPFPKGKTNILVDSLVPRHRIESDIQRDEYISVDFEMSKSLNISVSTCFGIRVWSELVKNMLVEHETFRLYFNVTAVHELFDLDKLDATRANVIKDLTSMVFKSGALIPESVSPMDKFLLS
ncbi:hypothetical protein ACTXO4_10970 [Glutamicibacter arilaitensis]